MQAALERLKLSPQLLSTNNCTAAKTAEKESSKPSLLQVLFTIASIMRNGNTKICTPAKKYFQQKHQTVA
jgi:hypothetical protein